MNISGLDPMAGMTRRPRWFTVVWAMKTQLVPDVTLIGKPLLHIDRKAAMIQRLMLILASCVGGAGMSSTCVGAETSQRPNVVYILADDLGYTDLACFGSQYYETPHLDRMAREGMRMTSAYTCGPNCQPTRAALMSGQYGVRTGIYTVGDIERFDWRSRPLRPVDNVTEMPLDRILLPQAFKTEGYATGHFGKWHLGNEGNHHPLKRGFDEGFVCLEKHFDFETVPPQDIPKGVYLADYLTDRAVDFIQRHKKEPFFLYLPHYGVHSPWEAKPELIERFRNKAGVGGHHDPTYAAMIFSVDESVGRIRKVVQELSLAEKTLIIFTSDNGGVGGYSREGIKSSREATDNVPLRGGKGMLYEGGIRVPYIACWPGVVPSGRDSDQPINSVDLYPTLSECAGISSSQGTVLDGTSYLSVLKGEKPTEKRRPLYWHFPGYLGASENTWRTTPAGAIRSGDWKLIEFFEDGRRELYNLQADIGEKQNLAANHPERVESLMRDLQAWRAETNAAMPTKNINRLAPGAGRATGGG